MRRLFVLASVVVLGGAALAWVAMRGRDADPEYDDEREVAAYERTRPDRIVVPAGFRLATATKLAPVDSRAATMFVDGQSVRVGERSFDPLESSGSSECPAPLAFVHALQWEQRLSGVVDAGTQRDVNVAIDATTPFDAVLSALRWLRCDFPGASLILATPSGALGTVNRHASRGFEGSLRIHISITRSGYEVRRGASVPPVDGEPNVRYGADCIADAEGISVPFHAYEDALTKCVGRAFGDEMDGHHYIDTIPGISLSAARDTPFEEVARAVVSGEEVGPVTSWTVDP